jgi:hypothetical protein
MSLAKILETANEHVFVSMVHAAISFCLTKEGYPDLERRIELLEMMVDDYKHEAEKQTKED